MAPSKTISGASTGIVKTDPALSGVNIGKAVEFFTSLDIAPRTREASDAKPVRRWQDDIIETEIPEGASVLDLGCNGGELLLRLMKKKLARVQGVELSTDSVSKCVEKGVPVFQADLDEGLKGFPDASFDYVVLEETLQTLHRPMTVLKEMLRVGRRGIISFPNFGFWRVRMELALGGRMPVTDWLPYRWHDTPNIHLFTVQDFLDWTHTADVRVVKGFAYASGSVREASEDDNLYAEEALYIVEAKNRAGRAD